MLGDKTLQFQGKNLDLQQFASQIEALLEKEGFAVQQSQPSDQGVVVQAKKGGFLRGVVDADRAFTVKISGSPNDVTLRFGIGKWLEHLGVAAVETLLVSDLFLVVDVAESAWNIEVEDKLIRQIKALA